MKEIIIPSKIIIPNCDLQNWTTLASDLFNENLTFWKNKLMHLGNKPSSLFFSYPLIFRNDKIKRPYNINDKIRTFEEQNIFKNEYDGYILVEREIHNGIRIGLVATVVPSRICLTENVHMQDIQQLKRNIIENDFDLPHSILLLDDRKNSIQNLYNNRYRYKKVYDFYLSDSNYNIKGWFLPKNDNLVLITINNINNLDYPFLFVGDGNHTFYAIQELVNQKQHQDLYLTEIVDLNAESTQFNTIYRIIDVTDKELEFFLEGLKEKLIPIEVGNTTIKIMVINKSFHWDIKRDPIEAIALIEEYLKRYSYENKKNLNYIYNYDDFISSIENGKVGIIMPSVTKNEYLDYILKNKKLPEKTFSIGMTYDKRYYLECRRVEKL